MKRSLEIASAFIGIVVGAGFASGQEILQYYTSFGYLGKVLTGLGSRMQTVSHEEVVL